MTFYTYDYLKDQNQGWQYLRFILIAVLIVVFIGFLAYYLQHRWNVKYKDLTVITGAIILLFIGFQINDLANMHSGSEQTSAITSTVKEVAKRLDVKPQKIYVNETSSTDNLLFKTPKGYYRTDYNSDGSEFVLEKLTLHDPKITITKE